MVGTLLSMLSVSTAPPKPYNTCASSDGVQQHLRYGISGRIEPDVPVPVAPSETLADAVCCDSRTSLYAEPQFLFSAPDIALFDKLDAHRPTVFYDAACGVPLFKAPVGRSYDDFKADTKEHGWPSFRAPEVNVTNVVTNKTSGLVSSICGTHLGTFLKDGAGHRWCIDLSCVAGSPGAAAPVAGV